MSTSRVIDRFEGSILGAGTAGGLRLVVGRWERSPLGAFTDVMVATADGRRILLAPDERVADYVARTYTFDEVVECSVHADGLAVPGARWTLRAGPLRCVLDIGARTGTGRLLSLLPTRFTSSRAGAVLADPVARRVHPGVRTHGTAGPGRREYYGAQDQHRVTAVSGTWRGADLGVLAPVAPAPGFGFSSTPAVPCLTRVTTTVVRRV